MVCPDTISKVGTSWQNAGSGRRSPLGRGLKAAHPKERRRGMFRDSGTRLAVPDRLCGRHRRGERTGGGSVKRSAANFVNHGKDQAIEVLHLSRRDSARGTCRFGGIEEDGRRSGGVGSCWVR